MNKDKTIIIRNCSKCGNERKLQKRSYEGNVKKNHGKYICYECYIGKNINYRLSECEKYWVGKLDDGVEFLFNGDDETIENVKSRIWHINKSGYVVDIQNNRLHRIIMKMDNALQLRHISGDKLDNRIENLLLPTHKIEMKKCSKCGKDCELVRRSYKDNLERNKGEYICQSCSLRKENYFTPSNDGTYWIGITNKREEFLFNGDDETIEYIKSCTWHVGNDGYIMNSNNERLHKLVMKVDKGTNVVVNHIGGNTFDNRIENLSLSTHKDNAKERKVSKKSQTEIVGLAKSGNKYYGRVTISDIGKQIITQLKDRDNALIDLLIVQEEYGYKHNQNLYYLLEGICDERKQKVLDYVNDKIRNTSVKVKKTNEFKLSQDKAYYEVYDTKGRMFKISKEDKGKIENGSWRERTKSSGKKICCRRGGSK